MILKLNELLNQTEVNAAWSAIQKVKKITFLTHYNPDADGVSACAALSYIAEKLGKQVETIYPTKLNTPIFAQPSNVLIDQHQQLPDLLIACDTANYERLYYPEVFKAIPLMNIDHHVSNKINGTFNFVASDVSSTCELVYHLLKKWTPELFDARLASMLLFGILYDTQVFLTNSTQASTLIVAADLIEKGAHLAQLSRLLTATKTASTMKVWGKLLQNLEYSKSQESVWILLSQEFCAQEKIGMEEVQDIHNFVMMNMPVDVVAFFKEVDAQTTKVSLRSSKTDVNQLAHHFGGGGHINAAGIMIQKPLVQVVMEITKLLP